MDRVLLVVLPLLKPQLLQPLLEMVIIPFQKIAQATSYKSIMVFQSIMLIGFGAIGILLVTIQVPVMNSEISLLIKIA